MFDVKKCSFIYLFYFQVVWDKRINVAFAPLCLPKWTSPCNQSSLNALWMLGTVHGCRLTRNMCWGLGEPWFVGETWQLQLAFAMGYVQFSSVAQSCPTLWNPMDCSTPGFPVLHQLLDLAQTHVHRVGNAIQPSHSLSSPSPPTFNLP